jgi:CDP-diacylglycerol pyrophosphatase
MRPAWPLMIAALLGCGTARAADPSALWKIVSGQCVPHEAQAHDPSPCAAVDVAEGLERGYAVLKDIRGVAQFLLIPTVRLGGIESPEILAPDSPNYFNAAWHERYFVEERLRTTLPREALSLAINSAYGRTQDQFHIHIDCISPDVREALARQADKIGDSWRPFPERLAGQPYNAMRIDQESLEDANPFRLLADNNKEAAANMGKHTLVLVGATFPDNANGFILLDGEADLLAGDRGSGEELQDHSCAVAAR